MLDKLKELLLKIKLNWPLLAFLLFVTKLMLISGTLPEVFSLLIVSSVYSFKMYLNFKEPKENNIKFKQDLDKAKNEISEIKNEISKAYISKVNKPKKYF